MKISYDCEDLIEEIKSDITEFGADASAWAIWKKVKYKIPFQSATAEADILINYLLDEDGGMPPSEEEMEGGRAVLLTLAKILEILEEQNSIIERSWKL